jgi:hypothetical protein
MPPRGIPTLANKIGEVILEYSTAAAFRAKPGFALIS